MTDFSKFKREVDVKLTIAVLLAGVTIAGCLWFLHDTITMLQASEILTSSPR